MNSDDDMCDYYSDEEVQDYDDDVEESENYDDGDEDLEEAANSDDDDNAGAYAEDGDRPTKREQTFTVLSEADIRQLQMEDITSVSNVLSISVIQSCILLCHYKWNISKVHDEWFANEILVRETVGLLEQPMEPTNMTQWQQTCRICFETYPCDQMGGAACGHLFCHGCWRGYISTSINGGPGCLWLRCPDPSCASAVGQDMVDTFVSNEDKEKYSRHLLRSYIEICKKTKWCPGPGCDFAIRFDMSSSDYDVSCRCTHSFCWNCREEVHRPVGCETVAKWILKNSAESENMNWILANSKACPKCKRPIEKNHGCMHMTCSAPCKFEFCWLCLGDWSEHGDKTGGFYSCNRYDAAKRDGVYDEDEKRRERAKHSLERYTHYYERWATNQTSRQKAIKDLNSMRNEKIKKLSEKVSTPETQLTFIIEAWEQIVECRRVLRWTYAYGYYIPQHEKAKADFFEHMQGAAESCLERLHACAEKDLECFFSEESPLRDSKQFTNFRSKLADLTRVTRNYLANLVHALEAGLQEVSSIQDKSGRGKGAGSSSRCITAADYENWMCSYCTFMNARKTNVCRMCDRQRS